MGSTLEERLAEFLADLEIPAETRALVKDRLDPDPPWAPEEGED